MKYWIDLENGEYGMVADTTHLPGLMVCGEGSLDSGQTDRLAVRAHEEGGVLIMEAMETFQRVFSALEVEMGMSFIHSPVAPTCAGNFGMETEKPAKWAIHGPQQERSQAAMAA